MIGSTLAEETAVAMFLFSYIETGLFGLKGPCQHQGDANKQTSTPLMVARCQRIVGKRLSIQNNRVSMDENGKIGFYPGEPINLSQRPNKTDQN